MKPSSEEISAYKTLRKQLKYIWLHSCLVLACLIGAIVCEILRLPYTTAFLFLAVFSFLGICTLLFAISNNLWFIDKVIFFANVQSRQ